MDIPKATNLLILRGVYAKDFSSESVYEKTVVEVEKIRPEPTTVYTEIPRKFTGAATWVKVSNLKCWECDQPATSYPRFIPLYLENRDGEDTCDVHGHFCGWNCAVRYAMTEFPKDRQPDILEAISLFESKFSGNRRAKIMPAPAKTEMRQYCGKNGLTLKQWHDKVARLNADYGLAYRAPHFRESN